MDQNEKPRVRHVYVCLNTDCVKRGSEFIHRELREKLGLGAGCERRQFV